MAARPQRLIALGPSGRFPGSGAACCGSSSGGTPSDLPAYDGHVPGLAGWRLPVAGGGVVVFGCAAGPWPPGSVVPCRSGGRAGAFR